MINKNQFEKSIIVIKENVPILLRTGYEKFNVVFKTVVDKLNSLNEEMPSSIEKATQLLFNGSISVFDLYSSFIGENDFKRFTYRLTSDSCLYDANATKLNSDEEFSLTNSTDIYAPLDTLELSLSAFNSKKFKNSKCKGIPITFEAKHNINHGNDNSSEKIDPILNSSYITNMFGRKTIFDELHTVCKIDFGCLCDAFFVELCAALAENKYDINALLEIKEMLNSDKVSDILTTIEKQVMSSAIATYLVYSSKLIGVKPDVFQWAYSAFVKDAQNHFDKSHYPFNAPVTVSSGHSVTGYNYGNKNNKYNEATVDMNVAQIGRFGGDDSSDPTKALIYRSIRLNHSAWSTVMNVILSGSTKNAFKDLRKEEDYTNLTKGYGYTEKTNVKIHEFALSVLSEYISAKTRTYNTSIQLTQDLKINESSVLMQFGANQIKEYNSAEIIKRYLKGCDERQLFLSYNENIAGLLTLNVNVSRVLADTFLDASYLLLLSYSHDDVGNIIEELDSTTGKTNKELFEEIYYGIASKINIDIEKYSYHENVYVETQNNIDASIAAYTPYFACNNNEDVVKNILGIAPMESTDESKEYDSYDPYTYSIYAPLISEYSRLKNMYCVDTINKDASIAVTIERNKGRFPKNRVVTTVLSYFGKNAEKRTFASLESIDEYLMTLESLSEEGADAMANNAAYSALGAIGGAITELEITNSADHNTTDKYLGDSENTDSDGYLLKNDSNDPEYMTRIVSGALESMNTNVENVPAKLVKKYNSIFNNMLLN